MGWRMIRKPDFFVVGAAKSGTTSLYRYLVQHPAIFMPKLKEPHFFGEWDLSTGVSSLEEYLDLFAGVPKRLRAGEATTSYLYSRSAAQEIKRFQPNAKIVMVLRDPVDRAYSNYWDQIEENLSFEEALAAEPKRIQQGWRYAYHYFEGGRYAEQVSRYLQVFGHDAVRIYLFEDLIGDAGNVCRDIFLALRVDPDYPIDVSGAYNPSGLPRSAFLSKLLHERSSIKEPIKKILPPSLRQDLKASLRAVNVRPAPQMNPETRSRLRAIYRDDILRLEQLIARDLSNWLEI
jgi:hypothetical protein